jgi:hypothetical protein
MLLFPLLLEWRRRTWFRRRPPFAAGASHFSSWGGDGLLVLSLDRRDVSDVDSEPPESH